MRRHVCTLFGFASLVAFILQPQHAHAVAVYAPLQSNLTALGPDNISVQASENIPAGSSGYKITGTDANGNPSESSDAGGTVTPGDQAIIEHYQTTDFPATSFFDVFVELSIPPGPLGSFQSQIINPTGESQTVGDAGFFLSPTEIPLDQLTEQNYPDSMFTPILGLNESLGSAGTDSADVTLPEPTTFGLLSFTVPILLRRRNR